jgi:hypothetical protein
LTAAVTPGGGGAARLVGEPPAADAARRPGDDCAEVPAAAGKRPLSIDRPLAADIQRYLAGRPVLARPQTTLYWWASLCGAIAEPWQLRAGAAMALVASVAYAGWRQEQAVREGQRALRMQTFMYRLFKLANSNYTGKAGGHGAGVSGAGREDAAAVHQEPCRPARGAVGHGGIDVRERRSGQRAEGSSRRPSPAPRRPTTLPQKRSRRLSQGTLLTFKGRWSRRIADRACAGAFAQAGVPPSVRAWSAVFMPGTATTTAIAAMRTCACCSMRRRSAVTTISATARPPMCCTCWARIWNCADGWTRRSRTSTQCWMCIRKDPLALVRSVRGLRRPGLYVTEMRGECAGQCRSISAPMTDTSDARVRTAAEH